MNFTVVTSFVNVRPAPYPNAVLVVDGWDDWFKFNTTYALYVFTESGMHKIGNVKIGQFGMQPEQRRPELPTTFDALDDRFFSLGQDDSYYERLNNLGDAVRQDVLTALRDLPFNEPELFDRAQNESVTTTSLLRSVAASTVVEQYRRLAKGGARLTGFEFSYFTPQSKRAPSVSFNFKVVPESQPPTNIHVIIGRNGVGKTYLLNKMSRALVDGADEHGRFVQEGQTSDAVSFANIVSVTFSAFDPFEPITASENRRRNVKYHYVGLKRAASPSEKGPLPPKTPQLLSAEFTNSSKLCRQDTRSQRWARALKMLESDPIFRDAQVSMLAPKGEIEELSGVEVEEDGAATSFVFSRLSSGHKVVLLTITKLVELVAERTLVLLDEPEAHLHPPLLSAFVRALSDLLIDRNGVAIIATHSPVILQEVPRSCVWKLRRSGAMMVAERPEIETFGENVGILTREAFGLEVTESGFHKMIAEQIANQQTYDQVLTAFGGELGGEARAIVRGLFAAQNEEQE